MLFKNILLLITVHGNKSLALLSLLLVLRMYLPTPVPSLVALEVS